MVHGVGLEKCLRRKHQLRTVNGGVCGEGQLAWGMGRIGVFAQNYCNYFVNSGLFGGCWGVVIDIVTAHNVKSSAFLHFRLGVIKCHFAITVFMKRISVFNR